VWLPLEPARAQIRGGEWRAYAADKTNSRYSLLDHINRDTASRLRVAWRQSVVPQSSGSDGPTPPYRTSRRTRY
jgi:glucose dehydrogenase